MKEGEKNSFKIFVAQNKVHEKEREKNGIV